MIQIETGFSMNLLVNTVSGMAKSITRCRLNFETSSILLKIYIRSVSNWLIRFWTPHSVKLWIFQMRMQEMPKTYCCMSFHLFNVTNTPTNLLQKKITGNLLMHYNNKFVITVHGNLKNLAFSVVPSFPEFLD